MGVVTFWCLGCWGLGLRGPPTRSGGLELSYGFYGLGCTAERGRTSPRAEPEPDNSLCAVWVQGIRFASRHLAIKMPRHSVCKLAAASQEADA